MQLLLFVFTFFLFSSPQDLNLRVSSTAAQTGNVHLAVYATAADYAAGRTIVGAVKPFTAATVVFDVELPAAGNYVISGYHDVNGNGKLDFNMMGIPKEPYGFVNPPSTKWKEPGFEEISTPVTAGRLEAKMDFKLWKEY